MPEHGGEVNLVDFERGIQATGSLQRLERLHESALQDVEGSSDEFGGAIHLPHDPPPDIVLCVIGSGGQEARSGTRASGFPGSGQPMGEQNVGDVAVHFKSAATPTRQDIL